MRNVLLMALLLVGALALSCANEPASRPEPATEATAPGPDALRAPGVLPEGLYSLAWVNEPLFMYGGFIDISTVNGNATNLWYLGLDPALWETPLGLAFDLDGTMYTTLNYMDYDPANCYSRFARIDPMTGAVTSIGGPEVRLPMNTCGGDIDAQGNYYTCGMDVPHLGYIHGDGYLYKFNKATGAWTRLPEYTGMTDWMDLAFDSQGRLWATTQNQLWTLDTATGAGTFQIHVTGVPGDPPPPPYTLPQEIMTIAFDKHDVLYATAINVEWETGMGAPVMKVDIQTGEATLLGYTHQGYNHGGDWMPGTVQIAHRLDDGQYSLITVSMSALRAHLAHGDYVPGTVGDPSYPG